MPLVVVLARFLLALCYLSPLLLVPSSDVSSLLAFTYFIAGVSKAP